MNMTKIREEVNENAQEIVKKIDSNQNAQRKINVRVLNEIDACNSATWETT